MQKIDFHIPVAPEGIDIDFEHLPPLRFNESAWFIIQNEGYRCLGNNKHWKEYSDEEIINKLYIDFRKIPGDITLRLVQNAFKIPMESREVAEALYEASMNMRIIE